MKLYKSVDKKELCKYIELRDRGEIRNLIFMPDRVKGYYNVSYDSIPSAKKGVINL